MLYLTKDFDKNDEKICKGRDNMNVIQIEKKMVDPHKNIARQIITV